jgi:hypothetical protein
LPGQIPQAGNRHCRARLQQGKQIELSAGHIEEVEKPRGRHVYVADELEDDLYEEVVPLCVWQRAEEIDEALQHLEAGDAEQQPFVLRVEVRSMAEGQEGDADRHQRNQCGQGLQYDAVHGQAAAQGAVEEEAVDQRYVGRADLLDQLSEGLSVQVELEENTKIRAEDRQH